jgi:hypothetical protein
MNIDTTFLKRNENEPEYILQVSASKITAVRIIISKSLPPYQKTSCPFLPHGMVMTSSFFFFVHFSSRLSGSSEL